MHDGELVLDDRLAAQLIARRFPALRGRELRRLRTPGTVNTIIRVGDDLVARFPLLPTSEVELAAEASALRELASASAFPAPLSFGVGPASAEFGSAWAVQTWLDGDPADPVRFADSAPLAHDLARLITSLRTVDVGERAFEGRGRGGHLPDHDGWVEECLARSGHLVDTTRTRALWEALRTVPLSGPERMSHRDLTPFNLLITVREERAQLVGVLDGGGFGPADPALDLVAAWHLFDGPGRRVLRDDVAASEGEWLRGAAWALQQALGLGWYYEESNPAMSALGLSTMRRLLADEELSAFSGG